MTPTSAPDAGRAPSDARLALVESLLASNDLHTSAFQCVEWLARHGGVRQALVAATCPDGPGLLIVAAHGISSVLLAEANSVRDDSVQPLLLAMERDEPTYFRPASGGFPPLSRTGFHAIPLRSDGAAHAHGLLLTASSAAAKIGPDVEWLARQLSRQVARLVTPQQTDIVAMLRPGADPLPANADGEEASLAPQLAQLERKMQEAFLANISHELRTPLNAILGYTHMLLQGVTGAVTEPQRKSLTRIDSNSRHLLAIVNDILDITRIESGRMPFKVTSFRIADLVDEVLVEFDPIIRRSNLVVSAQMESTLPAVHTDRVKVRQIMLNLLSNAVKFTPTGSVTVSATYEGAGRMVAIAVRDTGVGIPEEFRRTIFEDFRQLDLSPAKGHGGAGLGLSICRRLAKMLGGSIDVEGRVGEGSTFTLRLPVRARRR